MQHFSRGNSNIKNSGMIVGNLKKTREGTRSSFCGCGSNSFSLLKAPILVQHTSVIFCHTVSAQYHKRYRYNSNDKVILDFSTLSNL